MGKRMTRIVCIVTFMTLLSIFSTAAVLFALLMPMDIQSWKVLLILDNIAVIIGILPSIYLVKSIAYADVCRGDYNDPSFGLKTIFLWVFAIGVTVDEFFYMLIDFECLFFKGTIDFNFIDPAFLRFFTIMCIVLQLIIITVGGRRQLNLTWKVEVSLYLIIFLNIDFWLKGSVMDMGNLYQKHAFIDSYNMTNKSDDLVSRACFWESRFQNIIEHLLPYTMPMRFEFHLLAIVLLLRLGLMPLFSDISNTVQKGIKAVFTSAGSKRYALGSLSVGIIAALIFGCLRFLSKLHSENHKNETIVTNNFLAFLSAYNVFLITLVIGSFHIWSRKRNFPSQYREIMMNELVIVITGMFPMLYYCNVFIDSNGEGNSVLRVSASCTAMVSILYQTIFILCSNCYRMFTNPSYSERCFLSFVFISLGVGNMIYWAINTFTEMRDPTDWIVRNDKKWSFIHRFTDPLCTYYRFHISMEFYGQLKKLG